MNMKCGPARPGTDIPQDIPRKRGVCEWCTEITTVYGYALWVCRKCLEADRG